MLANILNYEPAKLALWQGRKDSLPGERFFQQVTTLDIRSQNLPKKPEATLILGFCSDEGIRRNEGRVGAKAGPDQLRQQLAKLACHSKKQFIDLGNILCEEEDLELAQQQFANLISHCHQLGYKTLALGGGHEIAWGHFSGLSSHYPQLGIINFDAHFDLRPLKAGQYATSGTPFQQIAQFCQENKRSFNYCCLGIQAVANTQSLFNRAKELEVCYLSTEQINEKSFDWQKTFIDDFILNQQAIYLSFCLDVFAESYAPGVSAPQTMGLTPWQVLPLLKYILQTGKVVSLDIAELSPPLDLDHKTARLAANLVAELFDYF